MKNKSRTLKGKVIVYYQLASKSIKKFHCKPLFLSFINPYLSVYIKLKMFSYNKLQKIEG